MSEHVSDSVKSIATLSGIAMSLPAHIIRYWVQQAELGNDLCELMNCTQEEMAQRLRKSVFSLAELYDYCAMTGEWPK